MRVDNDPKTGAVPFDDARRFVAENNEEITRLKREALKILELCDGNYDRAREQVEGSNDQQSEAIIEMLNVLENKEALEVDELIEELNNTPHNNDKEEDVPEDPEVLTKEQMNAITEFAKQDDNPNPDAAKIDEILKDINQGEGAVH